MSDVRNTAPPPMNGDELAGVAVGTQPIRDGRLACLECGRWYRNLGVHTTKIHDLGDGEYQRRFQLPAGIRLVAEDLRRRFAASARRQYPTNANFQRGLPPAVRAQGLRRAWATRQDSANRAGTRAAVAQRMATRSQAVRARSRERYDEIARSRGHPDIAGMLAALADTRDADLAVLLGTSLSTASRIRGLYGAPEPDPYARRAQQVRQGTRRRFDARARARGYQDLADLLAATAHLIDREVAALLHTSKSTANRLRNAGTGESTPPATSKPTAGNRNQTEPPR